MAAHAVAASPLTCTLKHRVSSKVSLRRCALPTLKNGKPSVRSVKSVVTSASRSQHVDEPQDSRTARMQERVERLQTTRREDNGSMVKMETVSFVEALLAGMKKLVEGANVRAMLGNTALVAGLAAIALVFTPGAAHAARSSGRMGGGVASGGTQVSHLVGCIS